MKREWHQCSSHIRPPRRLSKLLHASLSDWLNRMQFRCFGETVNITDTCVRSSLSWPKLLRQRAATRSFRLHQLKLYACPQCLAAVICVTRSLSCHVSRHRYHVMQLQVMRTVSTAAAAGYRLTRKSLPASVILQSLVSAPSFWRDLITAMLWLTFGADVVGECCTVRVQSSSWSTLTPLFRLSLARLRTQCASAHHFQSGCFCIQVTERFPAPTCVRDDFHPTVYINTQQTPPKLIFNYPLLSGSSSQYNRWHCTSSSDMENIWPSEVSCSVADSQQSDLSRRFTRGLSFVYCVPLKAKRFFFPLKT